MSTKGGAPMSFFRPRTPLWTYPDRLRVSTLALLYGFDFTYGLLFAFGGKADSPSQVILRQWVPVPAWGAFLAVAAGLAWIGYGERGGLACLVAWSLMVIASIVSIVSGTASSWGGPLIFGMVMGMHVITVYGVSSGRALRAPS